MNRCALLVYAFAMSLTSACNRSEAKEAERTLPSISPPVTVPPSPDVRGYFLGVSDDQAWFIYLEPGSAASTMYRPSDPLALCDVKVDAGGAVTFRSAVGSRYPFQFTGRLSHDTLVGTMSVIRVRTGAVMQSWPIAPRRVLPRFLTGAPDSLSGMYAKFEPGTDISGRTFVVLDLADRVVGFGQDFEGGPSTVWDIAGNRVKDTLHLTWRASAPNLPFASNRIISFVSTDVIRGDTLKDSADDRWPRLYSIPELLGAPHRSECR